MCSRLPRACSAIAEASSAWIRRSWAAKRLKTNRIAMNIARTRRRGWPTPSGPDGRGAAAAHGGPRRRDAARRRRRGADRRTGATARRGAPARDGGRAPCGVSGRPRSRSGSRRPGAPGLALRAARARAAGRGRTRPEGSASLTRPKGGWDRPACLGTASRVHLVVAGVGGVHCTGTGRSCWVQRHRPRPPAAGAAGGSDGVGVCETTVKPSPSVAFFATPTTLPSEQAQERGARRGHHAHRHGPLGQVRRRLQRGQLLGQRVLGVGQLTGGGLQVVQGVRARGSSRC